MNRVRRFRMEYDPHVTCCCSAEEHLSGEYVLYDDYMKLLREYSDFRNSRRKPDNARCSVNRCDNPAVVMYGSQPYCAPCFQPKMQGGSHAT